MHNYTSLSGKTIDYITIDTGSTSAEGYIKKNTFQLEEGTTATPYTPYIPLPIMTYQMNGNILSFEKDGTVKRTTKDANGNEVVVSRKGINLVRNGNFTLGSAPWSGAGSKILSTKDNALELQCDGTSQWVQPQAETALKAVNGNKIYTSLYTTISGNETSINIMVDAGVTQTPINVGKASTIAGWNKLEAIIALSGQTEGRAVTIYNGHTYSSSASALGQVFYTKTYR